MPRRALAAVIAAALALAAPPAAVAQDDGVFVDPDSPTGAEYDIPLERARRDATSDPGAREQPSRSRTGPLFGEGISAPAGAKPRPGANARAAAGRREQDLPASVEAAVIRPGGPEGGASSALLIGGAGLLVLALGAGGGVLLRRARA